MNATEARKLAQEQLEDSANGQLLPYVKTKIEAAARKGEFSIIDPLDGIRTPISPRQKKSVENLLVSEGYEVIHHESADSKDQRERSYTEVKW